MQGMSSIAAPAVGRNNLSRSRACPDPTRLLSCDGLDQGAAGARFMPPTGPVNEVTTILNSLGADGQAPEQLIPLVYGELRRLAAARLAQEPAGHTLQATALVHEAYLRLVGSGASQQWNSR